MLALLKIFLDIALWRKGPQHLPASGLLLVITIVIYLVTSLAIGSAAQALIGEVQKPAAQGQPLLLQQTLLELALTLAWIGLLLALFRRGQRFWQSATALLGMDIVISPIVVGTSVLLARIGPNNAAALPVWVIVIAAMVWYVLVIAHVVRSALDTTLFPALLLTIAYALCAYYITTRLLGGAA